MRSCLIATLILFFSFNSRAATLEKPVQVINIVLSSESPPTSYEENGEPVGIFVDYFKLVFSKLPQYKVQFHSIPWKRAQIEMQNNNMDVFLTCPTEDRKIYAAFTKNNLYSWDYGNIVFNKNNPKKELILKAKSFTDLKELLFLSQESVSWENENIPKYIERRFVHKLDTMVQILLGRATGDFLVMGQDQAHYFAHKMGLLENLQMQKVNFIENSQVKFHIGVRKSLNGHEKLLADIEKVLQSSEFQTKKAVLKKKYAIEFAKLN